MNRILKTASAALCAGLMLGASDTGGLRAAESLKGQFLVATEQMPDGRFAGTVILMVEHDSTGAMGLIINRPLGELPLSDVLNGVADLETVPETPILVHYGGPVQPQRGFVVHSPDYAIAATTPVTDEVSVTSDPKVLQDIAAGAGPAMSLFAIGYAGWGPSQLEGELARHDWITVPVDAALLFDSDAESKWGRALDLEGIDL